MLTLIPPPQHTDIHMAVEIGQFLPPPPTVEEEERRMLGRPLDGRRLKEKVMCILIIRMRLEYSGWGT